MKKETPTACLFRLQETEAAYIFTAPLRVPKQIFLKEIRKYVSCVGDVTPATDRFTTEFESAAFSGTACEVTDIQEKIKALRLICEKYTPDNMENFEDAIAKSLDRTAVWKIRIENLTGKRKKYDKSGEEMKFGRME